MQTRKEFILTISRAAAITLVASTTGYLLFREESKDKCDFDFVCKNCKKVKECNIDEGIDFKNTKKLIK